MEMELMTTVRSIAIHRKGDNPIFGETVIEVSLEDDAAGAYIIVKSNMEGLANGEIKLCYEEVQKILEVSSRLMKQESIKENN